MSMLYGNTSVFIDFEGMLYDTDTYVVRELYNYINQRDEPSMFDSMYELFDNLSVENIKYALQLKSFPNPLMEFIAALDNEDEDIDLEQVADEVYNSTLYNFKLPEGEITPETNTLRLTSIGAGLQTLLNDTRFKTLYIYVTCELNNDIITLINNDLDSDCDIIFLTGDKKKAMSDHICDFYFLSKLYDMYHICDRHHNDEINVLVPTFEFNMDDDGENSLVNLEENAIITKRKYNIEVCTTNIPIL